MNFRIRLSNSKLFKTMHKRKKSLQKKIRDVERG
jgi:hypothetical protein